MRSLTCLCAVLILTSACAGPRASLESQRGPATAPLPALEQPHWAADVIDPMTSPYQFESPLIQTNIRAVAIYHEFPETSLLGGGDLNAFALQARWAVTDRLAIIATKDGWVDFNPGALPDDEGFTDIAGGLKYALVDDPDSRTVLTAGLTYELTNGDKEVLQGNGAGMWRPFLSGLWATDAVNTIVSVGGNLPVSSSREPKSVDFHLHVSPADAETFVPLFEINGWHYIDDANGPGVAIEALDYGTVGTSQVKGQTVMTGALGMRWKVSPSSQLGVAYERPITDRKYIYKQRVMADWVLRF